MGMSVDEIEVIEANKQRRYRSAAALLRKWMAEDKAYDERTGAALDQELKDDTMQCRESDEPAT